ncbi:hypothetical protein M407DRAFT_11127 [Tulasnella calospora MUT 4182]|uniref:Uncharacterized protein n=1 Tax=Tulasnella calospora MUT 4182 TaxID=1051891 RepID=A0A0C3Q8E4_9AGAM|nr:hypothetical protein M407DRAFT_11127 [Tulasnella calospora MUT 4182]
MDLYKGLAARTLKFLGRGKVDLASAVRRLYTAATAQFVVYIDLSIDNFLSVFHCLRETEGFKKSTIWIPEAMPQDTSPFFNQLSLTLAMISIFDFKPPVVEIQNFCGYLGSYSDALINPNWRSLSLLAWTISQLPRIEDVSHLNIQFIRKVLRGDTVAALESIDSALKVISENREVHTLDHDRVLGNMIRCTSQVVADECPHPDLRLDQIVKVLQRAERVLRSASCTAEIKTLIEKLRKDTVLKVIRICFTNPQPGLRIAEISEDLFEALITLFITLKDPRPARFSHREDREAVITFTPLIEEIQSDTVKFQWEDNFYTNRGAPLVLRERLDAVQGTWAEFQEDVENLGTVCRAQSTFKQIRDPDMRWCHWQEESWGTFLKRQRLQTSIEELDKEHWQTFLKLSSKIHVLCISSFFLHPDSVALVKKLVAVYRGPLFPNLRRFEIYGDLDVRPMVPFGLVPGLISITLDGMDSFSGDDAFEDIFPQVAEKCKEIRELNITTECAQSGPMFDVFPDLRTMSYTFGAFSAESWSSLARCPNLRELELRMVSLETVTEDSLGGDLEFSSLRELRVFRMEKQNAIVLLGGTRMPRLQILRLEEIDFTEEEEKNLSDRLKVRCPGLKRIHFVSKP